MVLVMMVAGGELSACAIRMLRRVNIIAAGVVAMERRVAGLIGSALCRRCGYEVFDIDP